MQRLKFFSIITFFIFASLFIIKSSFIPFFKFILNERYGIDFNFSGISFCAADCVEIKGFEMHKKDNFDINIGRISFVPSKKSVSFLTSKWVISRLKIDNARVLLHENLFSTGSASSESSTVSAQIKLPFFPFENIDISSSDITAHIKGRDIKLRNISLIGNKAYRLDVPEIMYIDKKLSKPFLGKLSLDFFADKYKYDAQAINLIAPGIELKGDLSEDKKQFSAELRLDAKNASSFFGAEVNGIVNGSLSYRLDAEDAEATVILEGSGISFGDMRIWDFHNRTVLNKSGFRIDRLVLFHNDEPVAALEGTAKYSDRKVKGTVHLYDIDFENILNRMGTTTTVTMYISGAVNYLFSLDTLSADYTADLRVRDFSVYDNDVLDFDDIYYVKGKGVIKKDGVILSDATTGLDDNRSKVHLTDSWFDFKDSFQIIVTPGSYADITRLRTIAGLKTEGWGFVDMVLTSKYANPKIVGHAKATNCKVEGFPAEECDMTVELNNMVLSFLINSVKQGTIRSEGSKVSIDFNKEKTLVDFSIKDMRGNAGSFNQVFGLNIPVNGDFTMNAEGSYYGKLDKLKGRITAENLKYENYPVVTKADITLLDEKDSVRLDQSSIKFKNTALLLSGSFEKNSLESDIKVSLDTFNKDDFDFFRKFLFSSPDISLSVKGKLSSPEISSNVSAKNIQYSDIKLGDLKATADYSSSQSLFKTNGKLGQSVSFKADITDFDPDTLNADIQIDNYLHKLDDFFIKLSMSASIHNGEIDAQIKKLYIEKNKIFVKNNLMLKIQGRWDQLNIEETYFDGETMNFSIAGDIKKGKPHLFLNGSLFPSAINTFTGNNFSDVGGRIRFGLELDNRELSGKLDLKEMSLAIKSPVVRASDINASVLIDKNNWEIKQFSGSLGGGKLSLKGKGNMFPFSSAELKLAVTNASAKYKYFGNLSFSTDLDISLSSDEPTAINGDLELKNINYREDISLENELLKTLLKRKRASSVASSKTPNDSNSDIRLGLHIFGKNNLRIQNNMLKANVAFDTNLSGTSEKPEMTGTINLKDGLMMFKQNEFTLQRGIISVETDVDIKPTLDIEGTTIVNSKSKLTDYKLTLNIFGTPEDIQIKLSSVPQLDENQAYSLLLWGDFTDLKDNNTENLAISAVTDIIGISGEVKKNFNLTRFELTPRYSEIENKTLLKIVATKEIFPFLFFSLESNPADAADQSMELKYKGKVLDFIANWRYKNKLETNYGGIGFDMKLNYVFE